MIYDWKKDLKTIISKRVDYDVIVAFIEDLLADKDDIILQLRDDLENEEANNEKIYYFC